MTGTISALRMQRNGRRVNVFIAGEYAFALEAILAAGLHLDQPLSDADRKRLQAEDQVEEAARRCAGLIVRRPRSLAEVRRYLQLRRLPPAAIERVVQRLAANHLLDDAAFAASWVENRQDLHPRSRRALRAELRSKGVSVEESERALADVHDSAAALESARRKATRWEGKLPRPEFMRKILSFLALRGFDYHTAREAGEVVWAEHHSHEENDTRHAKRESEEIE
jgi:regulatory protein